MKKPQKLTYDFYNRHVVGVAKELIGKQFIFGNYCGVITETEAYRGCEDEASHAYRGITKRNAVMFGSPGHIYIYFIYGRYYCLNIVAEEAGSGSGVLIRGLKLPNIHLNGPGKLCKYLGITKKEYGINVVESDMVYLMEGRRFENILATPRIGIRKAQDKLWRFVLDQSQVNSLFLGET